VLAVLAHEHLAAEADDRVLGRPVAVVLEPPPVEGDHPAHVLGRPEDVVVEEAVAVVGGLLGDLRRADRGVPDERRHPVQRPRRGGEALQRRAEPALPVHVLLAPEPAQQRVVGHGEGDAVADVLTEPRVHRAGVAAAEHQVHPTVGEVLQHRVVLGDLHRVVGGDQRGRGGQQQPVGPAGKVAEQGRRRGRYERRVVLLAGGEHVEADFLGLARDLDAALDAVLGSGSELAPAAAALSAAYRSGRRPGEVLDDPTAARAYAAVRMPATFAAVRAALRAAGPGLRPATVLDIGGGTGAAVWAAAATLPSLRSAHVLDGSAPALALGRGIAARAPDPVLAGATWTRARWPVDLPGADLATLAYFAGELPPDQQVAVVVAAAERAGAVAVVEPGTPAGFADLLRARDTLVGTGFRIVAPCPHDLDCPWATGSDWCHFPA